MRRPRGPEASILRAAARAIIHEYGLPVYERQIREALRPERRNDAEAQTVAQAALRDLRQLATLGLRPEVVPLGDSKMPGVFLIPVLDKPGVRPTLDPAAIPAGIAPPER